MSSKRNHLSGGGKGFRRKGSRGRKRKKNVDDQPCFSVMSNTRCHQAHLLRGRRRRSCSPLVSTPDRYVRVVLIIIIYQLPPETITDGREIVIWVLLDFGHTPNNSLRQSCNKRHPTPSVTLTPHTRSPSIYPSNPRPTYNRDFNAHTYDVVSSVRYVLFPIPNTHSQPELYLLGVG